MTVMDEIKLWLQAEKKDFQAAVELLKKYGRGYAWYKNVFRNIERDWAQDKVLAELRVVLESMQPQEETGDNTETTGDTGKADPPEDGNKGTNANPPEGDPEGEKDPSTELEGFVYNLKLDELPDELKALVIEKGVQYDALGKLKAQLLAVPQNNEAANVETRKGLLDVMRKVVDRIKEIYAILRKFEQDGSMPETTKTEEKPAVDKETEDFDKLSDAELQVKLSNLRSAKKNNENRAADESAKPATRENNRRLAEERQLQVEKIMAILDARKLT
jgi:hypothetical protein